MFKVLIMNNGELSVHNHPGNVTEPATSNDKVMHCESPVRLERYSLDEDLLQLL